MKLKYIFCGIAFLAIAAGCSKNTSGDAVPEKENGEAVKQQVTINASIPETLTKVDLNQDPSDSKGNVQLTWKTGDQITVYKNGDHSVKSVFTLATGNGEKNATFTGDALDGAVTSFDIEYSNLPGTFATQTQPADASTSNLKYAASLTGVNAYQDIEFSQDWADSHGSGTFGQSSVLRLRAKLPAGAAATVTSVTIKAFASDETTPQELVDGGNTLTVEGITAGDKGESGIITVYATLPAQDIALPAGSALLFKFNTNASHSVYTHYRVLDVAKTFIQGRVNAFNLDCSETDTHAGLTTCDGTSEAKAYLIGDKYQMQAMSGKLVAGQKTYFKMVDDVDLNNEAWTPLNRADPYNKGIIFNGNGKTIDHLSSTGKYASFAGVLYGAIYNVVFDNATISSTAEKCGVVAGFLGTGTGTISANCHDVTVKNSTITNTARHAGGIAGIAQNLSAALDDCHVVSTTVTGVGGNNADSRAGGLLGELSANFTCSNSTAENVTISGSKNVGGLIGVAYGRVEGCSSSGNVSSPNTTSDCDISLGGLVGYFERGTITGCTSSVNIEQTNKGRDLGGLVGKMLTGTIEKSYSTGSVSGIQRNVGGLVGLITLTSGTASISDSYCTGNVAGDAYSGGFLGLHEKGTVTITNCYSAGNVNGNFGMGGFVGFVGAASFTAKKSAAWNGTVTGTSHGAGNWSTAAVVGVTFPKCTLTDNYRNPSMSLTAYWVPASGYQHANVSSSSPLIKQDGTATTATSTASGQDGYPQFPYHGKVEAGKTLSQLASTTLGWSDTIWDFSEDLPKLK